MNKKVTSKKALVEVAKAIAFNEGLSKVNIRDIAKSIGISVGAIYNYFPNKSDLVLAVIEDFWKEAIHHEEKNLNVKQPFINVVQDAYYQFYHYLKRFRSDWLQQMSSLNNDDKIRGKMMEADYFKHIKIGLLMVLENDSTINQNVWSDQFTKTAFIDFVFSNMMAMLRNNEEQIDFFILVLNQLLIR